MKFIKTKQFLIPLILLSIAGIVFYFYLFLEIKDKNMTISRLTNELSLESVKEERLRSIKSVIQETKESREKIDTYFITEDAIVALIETIEGFGGVTNASVEVNSVNVEELPTKNETTDVLKLTFSAEGEWKELFHVLSLVEALPFQKKITQALYEKTLKDVSSSNTWRAGFTVKIAKLK